MYETLNLVVYATVFAFVSYSAVAFALGCPFCMHPDFAWPLSIWRRGWGYLRRENRIAVIGVEFDDDDRGESE